MKAHLWWILTAVLSILPLHAESWNVASGNWSNPANWNPAAVPAGTQAFLGNGGTATVDSAVPNIGVVDTDGLNVNGDSVLNIVTGGSLTNAGAANIGLNSNATLNISDGTLTTAQNFNVGRDGGVGVVNQTGGTVSVNSQWLAIGLGGGPAGSAYNLSGGILNTSSIEVGSDRAATFTLNGTGTLNAGSMTIGLRSGGNGLATVSAGTLNSGLFRLGNDAGATGQADLSGTGTMNLTGNLLIGAAGSGTFNQTGGTLNLNNNYILLADAAGGTGVYNISAGAVNNLAWIHVGSNPGANGTVNINFTNPADTFNTGQLYLGNNSGGGTINVSSGKLNVVDLGEVGRHGGTGTLNVTGPNASVVTASNGGDPFFKVGRAGGNGTVNVTGGAGLHTTNTWYAMGEGDGSVGTTKVSGTGSTLHSNGLIVGWNGSGKGTLTIEDNAVVTNVGHELSVGRDNANTEGYININSGGVLDAGPEARIGHAGKGVVNINGGTLNLQGGGWAILGDGGAANGSLNMSSGTVTVTADRFVLGQNAGAVGTFTQTGGTTTIGNELNVGRGGATGTLNINGGTFTVNGWTTIGRDGAGTGTINVTNGGIYSHTPNSGDFLLGWNNGSHAYVNVESGGKMTHNWWVRMAVDPGSNAEMKVDGAGSEFHSDTGRLYIGEQGTGVLTISNGGYFEKTNSDQFNVGGSDAGGSGGGVGTINVSGTGSVLTTNNFIRFGHGNAGADPAEGTLNLSGGSVNAGGWIGFGHEGGDGKLNMSGGTITFANEFYVGIDDNGHTRQTTGTATISGGTITQTGGGTGFILGRSGGLGIMTINGTNLTTITGTNEFNIGRGGIGAGGGRSEGVLNISNPNATVSNTNGFFVGRETGKGTVNQAAGNVSAGALYVGNGDGSLGTINILGGTFVNHGWTEVGTGVGAEGTVTVNGPTAVYSHPEVSGDAQIGYNGGKGTIQVLNGGQFTTNWWLNVARGPTSTGIVDVDGAGSVLTVGAGGGDARLNVGEDGTGTMTISNGGRVNSLASEFSIATNAGSTGTLNVNTGGEIQANYLRIGGGTANVTFNNGILIANNNEGDFLRNFNTGNSELQAGGVTLNSNGFSMTLNNAFDGVGGITKVNAGTAILTAGHPYTGPTTVSGGILQVTGNINATSLVTVNSGAILQLANTNVAFQRPYQINGGAVQVTGGVHQHFADITFSGGGSISTPGGAAYDGLGDYALDGANIQVLSGAATMTATSGIHLNSSPTFNVAGGASLTIPSSLRNGESNSVRSLTKSGLGTLTTYGNGTYTGGSSITAGTVVAGGRGLGSGVVDVGPSGTLAVSLSANTGLASLYFNSAPADNGGFDNAYNNLSWLRGRIGSLSPATVVTTPVMNLNNGGATIPAGVGPDYYQGYYSGMINVTNGGTYTFQTGSDDGSMVWVDGQLVVSNNHFQGFSYPQAGGNINLAAGMHTIVIGFYEGGGGDSVRVGINGPDTGNVDIDLGTGGPAVTPDLVIGSLQGSGPVQLSTGNLILGTDGTSTSHSGVISSSGPGPVYPGIMKVGSGTQTLTGANTHAGGTILAAGKLILGGPSGTAAGTGDLTIAPATGWVNTGVELASNQTVGVIHFTGTDWSGLRPEGYTLTTAGLDSIAGKGVIENVGLGQPQPIGNGSVLVKVGTGNTFSYDGFIRDNDANGPTTLSLTKTGAGTQVLSGANISYSGGTTVNGGTLRLDTGSSAGTLAGNGPIVINNGGTLLANTTDALGFYNHTGANGITVNEGGILTVAAGSRTSMDRDLTVIGGTVASVGPGDGSGSSYTLRDSQGSLLTFTSSSGGVAATLSAQGLGLNGTATFNVTDGPGAVDLNVTGNLIDNFSTGSLTKNGAGTMSLSGNNSYTGATNLNGGTLLLGASNVLPDSSAIVLNGAKVVTNGNSDALTGSLTLLSDSVIDMGTGTPSSLTFASLQAGWTGTLRVWNWSGTIWAVGTDHLVFNSGTENLSSLQVQFYSDNGSNPIGVGGGFIGNELVPVPEPTAALAALLLCSGAAWRERRSAVRRRQRRDTRP